MAGFLSAIDELRFIKLDSWPRCPTSMGAHQTLTAAPLACFYYPLRVVLKSMAPCPGQIEKSLSNVGVLIPTSLSVPSKTRAERGGDGGGFLLGLILLHWRVCVQRSHIYRRTGSWHGSRIMKKKHHGKHALPQHAADCGPRAHCEPAGNYHQLGVYST